MSKIMLTPGSDSPKIWMLMMCVLFFYGNNVATGIGLYPKEMGLVLMVLDILIVVGMVVHSIKR